MAEKKEKIKKKKVKREKISKVEIINIPDIPKPRKDKIAWVAIGISILAVFVTAGSLSWTIYWSKYTFDWSVETYNQLLPLQEANVIFSESDISITQTDKCEILKPELKSSSCDIVNFSLRNNGRANAENIYYSIYSIFKNNEKDVQELFHNEGIMNILPAEGVLTINSAIITPHYSKNGIDVRNKLERVLVFFIKYTDEIGGEKDDLFFFSQVIGGENKVYNLSKSQYTEIEESLKNHLSENNRTVILNQLIEKTSNKN